METEGSWIAHNSSSGPDYEITTHLIIIDEGHIYLIRGRPDSGGREWEKVVFVPTPPPWRRLIDLVQQLIGAVRTG